MHSLRIIDTDLAPEAVNQKDPFESGDVKIIFIIISLVWIQDTAGGQEGKEGVNPRPGVFKP